jgi:hypothetical protein
VAIVDLAPPDLDAARLGQAVDEMLGARFVSRRGEPLGRHLVVIDALAA